MSSDSAARRPEDEAMATTIAILLFEGAGEMDFAGPWEVLGAAIQASRASAC